MIQKRDIVKWIIFTIITCGIYGIFWFININDDTKKVSNDTSLPSGGMVILHTIITCGIYGFYWIYQIGKLLYKAETERNMPGAKDNTILYLILQIVGLGIVNYVLIQSELNEMAG